MRGKEIILGVLTIAAGVFNAYLWKGIVGGGFNSAAFYSAPVLALFLFAILFALSSSFIRARAIRIAVAVLSLAVGYLFIPYSLGVLSGLVLSAAGGWYAAEAIANEFKDSHSFSVRKIFKSGLPVFFTALVLLLTIFYFSSVADRHDQVLLPKAMFDVLIQLFKQPLQSAIPWFRAGESLDQTILDFAARQSGIMDVSKIPVSARAELISEGVKALEAQLGVHFTGKETSEEVLYKTANVQVEKLLGSYKQYTPFIAAAGFFLAVKTLTIPIYWVTLLLVFIVVRLLEMLGILKKEVETIQVERLTL